MVLTRWRTVTLADWSSGPWVCHYEGQQLTRLTRAWKTACRRIGLEGEIISRPATDGHPEHGPSGDLRTGRDADQRAQDPLGLRPLPHREPRGPPGGRPKADGHNSRHNAGTGAGQASRKTAKAFRKATPGGRATTGPVSQSAPGGEHRSFTTGKGTRTFSF